MKIFITPPTSTHPAPALTGLQQTDDRWQLNLKPYRHFISDVTGVTLADGLSPQELKIIQSRLEGCVESYTRSNDCKCNNLGQYDQIDSFESIRELAQVFRFAVENGTTKNISG